MPNIFIPNQWRDLTDGVERVEIEGTNVRQIIRGLEERFPGVAARAIRDEGLSPGLAVSVDGAMTSRLLAAVAPTSEVHFLPAIGGG